MGVDGDNELSARQEAILRAVVQGYVSTSRPVGSSAVTSSDSVDVSAATVRKELGALEDEGFLLQPHTSAGRIPTEKGYRYFVDALMMPADVGGARFERINEFFTQTHGELERMLKQTSTLIADETHYAAVVTAPEVDTASIKSVQLVDLAPTVVLLVVVLSNGAVERRTLDLETEMAEDEVRTASDLLSEQLVGRSVGDGALLLDDAAPPDAAGSADERAATANALRLATAAAAALDDDSTSGRVFVGGQSSVAGVFEATETVAQVLSILERQLLVVSLIRDVLGRGLRVAIGSETGVETLNECAIVVAPYMIEGEEAGSIGVLGPQRMNYAEALATVAIVSDGLSTHLSDR